MDESTSFPTGWFLSFPFDPAVMVGTEYSFRPGRINDWHLAGNLGFWYHRHNQTALFVQGAFGYRRNIGRWNVFGRLGAAYVHSFAPTPVFRLEDGSFQTGRDSGTPAFMPSLELGGGYRLGESAYSPEIFASITHSAEFPLNEFTGLHQFAGIGIKFYPFSSKH